MKLRCESRGLHFYDRVSGYHVLLDEKPVPRELWSRAPSLVSIALTNICDLACEFCYAPKSTHHLAFDDLLRWCKELDALGTLEVAFGGGEPTLYRELPELCAAIWEETELGISITTHGHHLNPDLIARLRGNVSIIRISVDAPEPTYSAIRGRSLNRVEQNVQAIDGQIPVGVNTVINSETLNHLDKLATLVESWQATDWLLLPEIRGGLFTLTSDEWARLSDWLTANAGRLQLNVTYGARPYLRCPFLFDDEPDQDYVHISADGYLRLCSYERGGVLLRDRTLKGALDELFQSFSRNPYNRAANEQNSLV
ncbi:MAG TPA: radical SAM protein [Pyrinomonadaceae bacterium]